MVYAPKIKTISDSQIIDNVMAIVKRDGKPAIDYYFPLIAAGIPLLDASAARAEGITTLHMDGFTTKPGEGDLFTIAGDVQVYQVISSTTLVGTDSDVTFQPGLKVAIPAVDGNEVVTFSNLPDFAERTLGRFFRLSYPAFMIDPDRSGPIQSADGSWVEDTFRVGMFLAVADVDGPTVTRKAMKYTAIVESIIRNASVVDFTTGITPGLIFALTWELSYQYGEAGGSAALGYNKPVSFELLMKFNER